MAANADVVFRLGADVDEAIAAIKRAQGALADLGDPRKTPAPAPPPLGAWGIFGDEVKGALSTVSGGFVDISKTGTGASNVIAGVLGGAVGGAVTAGATAVISAVRGAGAALLQFGRESVSAALEAEEAGARLRTALSLAGMGEQMAQQLEALNASLQRTTRYSDEALSGVQAIGAGLGVAGRDLPAFTRATTELAAALGVDLATAAQRLGETLDGTVGRLGEKVPELDALTEAELRAGKAIDVVASRLGGFAASEAQTTRGAITQLANAWDELKESVGGVVLEIPAIGQGLTSAVGTVRALTVAVQDLGPAFTGTMSMIGAANPLTAALNVIKNQIGGLFQDMAAFDEVYTRITGKITSAGGGGETGVSAAQREMQARIERDTAEMVERRKAEREATEAAKKSAIEKAEAEAAALRNQLKAIDEVTFATFRQRSEIEGMDLSIEREVGLYDELDQRITAAGSALFALYQSGKIDADQYQAKLDSLIGAHEQLAEQTAAARLEAFATAQAGEIASGGGVTDVMGVDTGTGAAMDEDARAAQAEMAAEMAAQDEATFQRKLALIEQGYSVAEAESILTEELLRQSAANGNLAAAQEMQIRAAERQGQAAMRQRANLGMVANAAMQTTMAFAQMAVTGELSAKKMAAVMLQQLSQIAQQKMVEQTALALGSYPDAGGMAHHFAAAAAWGLLAGAAAGMSSKMSGGASAGAGGSEDDGRGSSISGGTDTFARDVAEGQRMPAVTVQFTGNGIIAGTTPEAFAGAITPFIQDVVSESGGRNGSMRP